MNIHASISAFPLLDGYMESLQSSAWAAATRYVRLLFPTLSASVRRMTVYSIPFCKCSIFLFLLPLASCRFWLPYALCWLSYICGVLLLLVLCMMWPSRLHFIRNREWNLSSFFFCSLAIHVCFQSLLFIPSFFCLFSLGEILYTNASIVNYSQCVRGRRFVIVDDR